MTENNYGIRARLNNHDDKGHMLLSYFHTEARAKAEIEILEAIWNGVYTFEVVPPSPTEPASTEPAEKRDM